jgi:hypothetical protein
MDDIDPEPFELRQKRVAAELEKAQSRASSEEFLSLLFGIPIFIPIFQSWQWLRYGEWHPLTSAVVLDAILVQRPYVSWVGIQKIIDSAWDIPLIVFAYITCILIWLLIVVADEFLSRIMALLKRVI